MTPQKSTMSILAQIARWIPDKIVGNLARKYKIQTRAFSADSHVIAMLYAHLSHGLSLNDVCDGLRNHAGTLSQIRRCTPPSRNGLSHANKTRNAAMAEELFWKVYESLERRHPEFLTSSRNYPGLPYRFRRRTLRAVDSTTISLTAYNMAWAKHRRQKAAAKMHTALNMRSFLPNFVIVKGARDSDPKTAWELCSQMRDGEIVVFDKAYVDFRHLQALKERGVSWVTRSKDNMLYEVVGRHVEGKWVAPGSLPSSPVIASCDVVGQQAMETEGSHGGAMAPSARGRRQRVASGDVMGQQATGKRKYSWKKCKILSDEKVKLTGVKTKKHYPDELRLVKASVEIKGKMSEMAFISDNLEWSSHSICQLYQCRWGVEVFFKEIKQTLQLADFLGYSENAVRWQVWTALLAYLLLRFVAWLNQWKHQFSRLFTLVRAVLWNMFRLDSLIQCCDTRRERRKRCIRGSPETAYQLAFDWFT